VVDAARACTGGVAGLALGGVYGFFEGMKNVTGTRFRIKLNSVLNGCGRRGARTGNGFGVLALLFSASEGALDYVDTERFLDKLHVPRSDMTIPMLAGGLSAMAYRIPTARTCRLSRAQPFRTRRDEWRVFPPPCTAVCVCDDAIVQFRAARSLCLFCCAGEIQHQQV
jgi:hypothetical protein